MKKASALLSALFITAIAAISATLIMSKLRNDIKLSHNFNTYNDAYYLSSYVNSWAKAKLLDPEFKQQHITAMPPLNTKFSGSLIDLQSYLNINSLTKAANYITFNKVLEKNCKKIPSNFLNTIRYWISPYSSNNPNNYLRNYYINLTPAILPPYQAINSLHELKAIKDTSNSLLKCMNKYFVALPKPTKINILTAPDAILTALKTGLTQEKVIARHQSKTLDKLGLDNFTTESNYFLAQTIVNKKLYFNKIFLREKINNKVKVSTIVW